MVFLGGPPAMNSPSTQHNPPGPGFCTWKEMEGAEVLHVRPTLGDPWLENQEEISMVYNRVELPKKNHPWIHRVFPMIFTILFWGYISLIFGSTQIL